MTMAPLDPNQLPGIFGGGISVPAPKAGGGMFGNTPNWANAVQAAIGGYLAAGNNPAGQNILQNLFYQRQMAQRQALEEEQYQRRRSDDMTDWQAKQQWQLDHPAPANPHFFEDNSGNLLSVLPGQDPQMVYKDPNPWKLVPNGMGGVIPVNMQDLMSRVKPAPAGVTFTPIDDGGPAVPPPGPFPFR